MLDFDWSTGSIFLNEKISQETFYGGIIVIVSVAVYSFLEIKKIKIKAVLSGWLSVDSYTIL